MPTWHICDLFRRLAIDIIIDIIYNIYGLAKLVHILLRKLMLLGKLLHSDGVKLSSHVFHIFAAVDVYKIDQPG